MGLERGWTAKIIVRYILLQIPMLILVSLVAIIAVDFFKMQHWGAIVFIAVWILKDSLMFFLVWPSYDWEKRKVEKSIIGEQATVQEILKPTGYVRYKGELWKAQIEPPDSRVKKRETVRIIAIESGMLLKVVKV